MKKTDFKIERKVQDAGHLIGVLWIDGAFQGTLSAAKSNWDRWPCQSKKR